VKVFLQAKDESVVINGDVTITVLEIDGDEVILGINAPEWVAIEEGPKSYLEIAQKSASLPAR
jgi:carbon storage regulator CsrA